MDKIKLSAVRAKFPMYNDVPDDQLIIGIHRKFYPQVPFADFNRQIEYDNRVDPTDGMSGLDKFSAGVGKAIVDTGRGLGQMVGAVSRDDVAQSRALDAPLLNTGAGMAGNLAGNIGMALAPGGIIKGAGMAATAAGAARAGSALSTAGGIALAPTSIPAALGVGAIQGAIQPSASDGETIGNIALGSAASAAVPALVRAGQVVKSAIDPFTNSGQSKIIGRAMHEAAGGFGDDAMRNMQAAKELVPGSLPSAAEAAQNPGIAALQRTAVATDPVAMNQMAARQAANNTARISAIEDISGAGGKREFFAANRDAVADPLYAEARRAGIDPRALTPEAQANIAAFQQRIPEPVMQEARQLAKINGETMGDAGSVQGLHWIKKGIDSLIKRESGPNGSADFLRAYMGLKNDLMTGLENLSPKYAEGNAAYAQMSRPINQMDVASELLDKSVRKSDGRMLPGMYARTATDDLAAKVTGIRSNTLDKVMEPAQNETIRKVQEDLTRMLFAENAGRGVGSDTVQKLAYSNIMAKSGLPNFMKDLPGSGLVGRVADLGYKRANSEMSSKLAQSMLDPKTAAQHMKDAIMSPQVERLLFGANRGGAAIGSTTPYLLNAMKSAPQIEMAAPAAVAAAPAKAEPQIQRQPDAQVVEPAPASSVQAPGPDMESAASIRADYKSKKLTRQQAIEKLRAIGLE